MDKKSRNTIVLTFLVIISILLIIGSLYVGKILNPMLGILLFEIIFNFVVIPSIVNNYYKLYNYQPPSVAVRYCPFYNMTKIMSPITARLSIFSLMFLIVGLVLSRSITLFSFLGQRLFLIIYDGMPYLVFFSAIIHFICIGVGLGGVSLKVKGLFSVFFEVDADDFQGFFKVLGKLLSTSKYLEVILFTLPVFRLIPAMTVMENCRELVKFGAVFDDYIDPHDYDDFDEYYDEEDDEK